MIESEAAIFNALPEPILPVETSSIDFASIAFAAVEVIFPAFTVTLPFVACKSPFNTAFPVPSSRIFPDAPFALTVVPVFCSNEVKSVKLTLLAVILSSITILEPE